MKKLPGKKPRFLCEELEPRILLSAGIEGLILDAGWEPDVVPEENVDAAQIAALFDNNQTSSLSEPSLELVFIDSSLPDYQSLVDDLENNNDTDRHFEVILLNNEHDGISQVTSVLQSYDNIDAVHFITHGEDGRVQLGNTLIDQNNVEEYSSEFLLWQATLAQDADILFYGCDLASSDNGLNLIQTLSTLTDADVAASDDTTGNSELNGDWNLEQEIGSIETDVAFSYQQQESWMSILPIITFQEGVNGYTSTVDTQINELLPGTSYDDDADISVDGGAFEIQALVRFDNIFGSGANQIEFGSTINSATMTFNITNSALNGSNNVEMYAMLVNWNDSSTWNSFTSVGNNTAGVQTDGTDAATASDSSLGSPKNATGSKTFSGLETTLQSWSDGGTNFGWVIINDSTNNWSFSQSDDFDITNPILTVDYTANASPVFTSSATPTVTENTTAVTTVTASDVDGDTPTFSITGATADDGLFSITPGGVLTFNAAPDFENPGDIGGDNTYNIEVTADDGNGGQAIQNIAITVTNVNEGSPVFTSSATPTVTENTTAVTTVTASDVDGDTPTFSITGVTADDALFSITPGGVLTFDAAPDFENPGDIGGDNTYNIEVTADDGNGGLTVQNIAVTVTNVNEGSPVFTSSATPTLTENTTAVTTVTATDLDNDTVTYSITGVTADDALFSITPGGVLTFNAAPDFENPGDIGGDNTYNIEVTADDGNGGQAIQNIAITVTNVNEGSPVFTSSATPTVTENTTAVTTVTTTDLDNDTVTYSITGVTADDALFSITPGGVLTFDTAPDFENPGDIGGDNTYNIEVTADDGNGGQTIQNIVITVTDANEAPVITSGATPIVSENTILATTVTASDVDGDTPTFSITGGADAALFSIDNLTGALTFNTAPDFETPADSGANNIYDVQVTADDGNGGFAIQNISITVTNANEIPIISDQQLQVSGNSIINGNVIGVVNGSDADTGDTLSYTITDGTGAGIFAINSTTGEISIINSDTLNNSFNQVYTLAVTVTDSTGASSVAAITISVFPTETIPSSDTSDPVAPIITDSERTDSISDPVNQNDGEYRYIGSHKDLAHQNPVIPEPTKNTADTLVKSILPREPVSVNPLKTAYLTYKAGGTLFDAINAMKQDIDESSDNNDTFYTAIKSTGIVLTAGFASWALRGGSILASFLSTMPIWRGLDPLPILAAAKNNPKKVINITDPSKDTTRPDDVDSIFSNQPDDSHAHNSDVTEQGKNSD